MKKGDFLKEVLAKKKERVLLAKQQLPLEELKSRLQALGPARPFVEAIHQPRQLSLIAEIKKASPSAGIIRQDFNIQDIAHTYEESGARAI